MFSTSRRPVPSPAALRILRQLAYISSGTVCGAAALIAEERRRRTGIARKIVENARRLKQHPRYAHSATARKLETSFFGAENDWTDDRAEAARHEEADLWDSDVELVRTRPEPDAFRSEELPSAVHQSYRKFSRKHDANNRTRKKEEETQQHGSHLDGPHTSAQVDTADIPMHSRHQQRDSRGPIRGYRINKLSRCILTASPHEPLLELDLNSLGVGEIEQLTLDFRTRHWKDNAPNCAVLATRLLHAATRVGSIESQKDIVYWLLKRNNLDASHLATICVDAPATFSNNDSKAAQDFYTSLLRDRRLRPLENIRLCKLLITATILDADHSLRPETLRLPLSQSVKKTSLSSSQLAEYTLECCHKLLILQRPASIVRLLRHCAQQLHVFDNAPAATVDELFDLSLQSQDLPGSARLLRYLDENSPNFGTCLEKLAIQCEYTKEDALLVKLHRSYSKRHPFSEILFVAVCSAYARMDSTEAAKFLMRSAKQPTSESILAATLPAWPALIRRVWGETRNLGYTRELFRSMRSLAGEASVDVDLYNAIIVACINAGKPEKAEGFLRQMQTEDALQPDVATFGAFVLSAAMARDWPTVQKLLGMLNGAIIAPTTATDRIRLFNPVLREYAYQHDPVETWSFVSTAVDVNGMIPDQTTFNVVLESFVRGQRLDLIQPWYAYMHTCGYSVAMKPYTAMRMIRRYFYDMRPSHIITMWLCRNIVTSAPHLLSNDLMLLVREAIGHDIRAVAGPSASRRFEIRRARLKTLEHAHDHIPTPSVWSDADALHRKLAGMEQIVKGHVNDDEKDAPGSKDLMDLLDIEEDVDSGYASDSLPNYSEEMVLEHEFHDSEDPGKENLTRLHSARGQSSTKQQDLDKEKATRLHALLKPSTAKHQAESDILIALSLGQPSDAVNFYKRSLAASGLPHSSISLETAIAASIRAQWGDSTRAEDLLHSAQENGLNTTATLTPIFMQRIASMKDGSRAIDPAALTRTVLQFYQTMEENGIRVRHHVATVAAYALYKSGKAEHAITLLRGVHDSFRSHSSSDKALDIEAMTVLLQSYIRTQHVAGIEWTINTVLKSDMRVDKAFMRVLKSGKRHYKLAFRATGDAKFENLLPTIQQWLEICRARQVKQIKHSNTFGRKLVRCILDCAHKDLSRGLVELGVEPGDGNRDVKHESPKSQPVEGMNDPPQLSAPESIIPELGVKDSKYPKGYRLPLRRGIDEHGRLMKFRYYGVKRREN